MQRREPNADALVDRHLEGLEVKGGVPEAVDMLTRLFFAHCLRPGLFDNWTLKANRCLGARRLDDERLADTQKRLGVHGKTRVHGIILKRHGSIPHAKDPIAFADALFDAEAPLRPFS